jgi:hypothetical protein
LGNSYEKNSNSKDELLIRSTIENEPKPNKLDVLENNQAYEPQEKMIPSKK